MYRMTSLARNLDNLCQLFLEPDSKREMIHFSFVLFAERSIKCINSTDIFSFVTPYSKVGAYHNLGMAFEGGY